MLTIIYMSRLLVLSLGVIALAFMGYSIYALTAASEISRNGPGALSLPSHPLARPATTPIAPTQAGCPLNLSVTGGIFTPTSCQFQVHTPGPACEDDSSQPVSCPKTYILAMDGSASGFKSALLILQKMKKGTYRFSRSSAPSDLIGQISDQKNQVINLQAGDITLEPAGATMTAKLDLTFGPNIKITGSGTIPVISITDD